MIFFPAIIMTISNETNREPSNTKRSYFFRSKLKNTQFLLVSVNPTRWRWTCISQLSVQTNLMLEFVRVFYQKTSYSSVEFLYFDFEFQSKNHNLTSLELKNKFIFRILSALPKKIFYIPIAKDPNLNKQSQLCLHPLNVLMYTK